MLLQTHEFTTGAPGLSMWRKCFLSTDYQERIELSVLVVRDHMLSCNTLLCDISLQLAIKKPQILRFIRNKIEPIYLLAHTDTHTQNSGRAMFVAASSAYSRDDWNELEYWTWRPVPNHPWLWDAVLKRCMSEISHWRNIKFKWISESVSACFITTMDIGVVDQNLKSNVEDCNTQTFSIQTGDYETFSINQIFEIFVLNRINSWS